MHMSSYTHIHVLEHDFICGWQYRRMLFSLSFLVNNVFLLTFHWVYQRSSISLQPTNENRHLQLSWFFISQYSLPFEQYIWSNGFFWFQFGEQVIVWGCQIRRTQGLIKRFESTLADRGHSDSWCTGRRIALVEKDPWHNLPRHKVLIFPSTA